MHELPDELPVMTLPHGVFFPRTVMPLHIFEPRYRAMLQDCLRSHRIFAVAALDRFAARSEDEPEPPARIATAGVIRACQKNEDGTSNLLLEGMWRIYIEEIVQQEPYRLIRVQELPDTTDAGPDDLERLRDQLLRVFDVRLKLDERVPRELRRAMRSIDDAAALCDLMVYALVRDSNFKQQMLETIDPAERLRRTIARFRSETESLRLQRKLQGPLGDEEIGMN